MPEQERERACADIKQLQQFLAPIFHSVLWNKRDYEKKVRRVEDEIKRRNPSGLQPEGFKFHSGGF